MHTASHPPSEADDTAVCGKGGQDTDRQMYLFWASTLASVHSAVHFRSNPVVPSLMSGATSRVVEKSEEVVVGGDRGQMKKWSHNLPLMQHSMCALIDYSIQPYAMRSNHATSLRGL